MLLLAVLSVLLMLALGFAAILCALADIEGRRDPLHRSAEPVIQVGISVGPSREAVA